MSKNVLLKIAVIGAGPSGLCCAKNALSDGHNVTVYEQNSSVGGQWVYTEQTGNDEFGLPIHSSMYDGLITNLPVESMGYLNHPFPKKDRSFVKHDEVLAFFQSYVNQFNLERAIKFRQHVIHVEPFEKNCWRLVVKDLRKNTYETEQFDAIFICNGHYSSPSIPDYKGLNEFVGEIQHSHDYRRPEVFAGKRVLIVGSGPSGRDIMYEMATKASKVYVSHHRKFENHDLPLNLELHGDVERFTNNSVEFVGGTGPIEIDSILFCTGYKFTFPFLSVDCGLAVDDGFTVHPLYKHLINIKRPTMAIVGLQICAYTFMYDLQARLCLKYWTGKIPMPTEDQMMNDYKQESIRRKENGNVRHSHLLDEDQTAYLRELSTLGQMIRIPEVLLEIYLKCNDLRVSHPNTYRNFNFKILDEKTFEVNYEPSQ